MRGEMKIDLKRRGHALGLADIAERECSMEHVSYKEMLCSPDFFTSNYTQYFTKSFNICGFLHFKHHELIRYYVMG